MLDFTARDLQGACDLLIATDFSCRFLLWNSEYLPATSSFVEMEELVPGG